MKGKKMSLADFRTLNGFKTEEQKAAEQATKQAAEQATKQAAEQATKQAAEDIKLEIITIEEHEYDFSNKNLFLVRNDLIVGYCHHIDGDNYAIKSGIDYDGVESFIDACYFFGSKRAYAMPTKITRALWLEGHPDDDHDIFDAEIESDDELTGETLAGLVKDRVSGQWVRTSRGCYWQENRGSSTRARSYGGHKD